MEFDLGNLEDSVFEVHEEVITDHSVLFRLDKYLDSVLRNNPAAKMDGVFRGRLSADLRKEKTNFEDFWKICQGTKKQVTVQYLIASDQPESKYSMEHITTQVPGNTCEFVKQLNNSKVFENLTPTCCSEILRKEGPKQAVKHFYEALMSKRIVIPKMPMAEVKADTKVKKARFNARQSVIQEQDPSIVCALVEQSMMHNLYKEVNQEPESHVSAMCKCQKCYLHRESEAVTCSPINLKKDGSGDNCALYLTDFEEDRTKYLYVTPNFALSHLCHLNMLTDLDSYYAGVSFPFVYVGGLHSFFALHVEDMSLPSINYMHMGHPKLWVVVAPTEVTKLSIMLSNYGLHNIHRVCVFKLSHKSFVVFPQLLLCHKIKFKIIIQEPGDFIFISPNAAHTGGNMGLNVAEACNVGTVDWLPYGSVASSHNCCCLEDKVHMDMTPLFKIHRPDLLQYHENSSMTENYIDDHFKSSVIAVPSAEFVQFPLPNPEQRTPKKNNKKVAVKKERVCCPVEDCLKTYQAPVNRAVLLKHIRQEHPKCVKKTKYLKAVDRLCCKTSRGSGQRCVCSACGADISIYSNRHMGSKACKERSAKANY